MVAKFFKDTGVNILSQALGFLCGLVSSIIIARILGPEQLGIMAVIMLLPYTLGALVSSGFSSTVIHATASGKWKDDEIIAHILGGCIKLCFLMAPLGIVGLFYHETFFHGAPLILLGCSLMLPPIQMLGNCLGSVITAKRKFHYHLIGSLISSPMNLLIVVLLVYVADLNVIGALSANIISSVLGVAITLYFVSREIGWESIKVSTITLRGSKEDFFYSLQSQTANIAAYFNTRIDQYIINATLGTSSVGIYSIAVNNTEKLWLLVKSFGAVIFPAAAEAKKTGENLAGFTARLSALMLWLLVICASIVGIFAKDIINFLYGAEYSEAGNLIRWLLPGIVALGHSKIVSGYIAGTGKPSINAARGIGALILNIVLNLILIPIYGIKGAAIATSISYSLSALVGCLFFIKIENLRLYDPFIPKWADIVQIKRKAELLVKKFFKQSKNYT